MVAVVIMTVGVLALAGTSATVSRLIGGAGQRTVAANTASSRFEKLRGRCGPIPSGTATANGMREHWGVELASDAVTFAVVDTVWFLNVQHGTSRQVFRTNIRVTC